MDVASSSQDWKETVKPMLAGINRYNPENIETLEQYVQFQVESNEYDFEANLTLMKLYQFQPSRSNAGVATQILVKALTNLPKTDFILLKCVLPQNLQRDLDVQQVINLHSLLESCQFREFWPTLRENPMLVEEVSDFEASIRSYICDLVAVSYQNISMELLRGYLGGVDDATLSGLAVSQGWEVAADTVSIHNQEEHIKPKKILAKIEFDSVSGILTAAAAR